MLNQMLNQNLNPITALLAPDAGSIYLPWVPVFLKNEQSLYHILTIVVLSVIIFFSLSDNPTTTGSGAANNSGDGSASGGGSPDDDEETRRRRRALLKKILIGLGVTTAVVGVCCGAGFLLCEGDWFAIVRDPKLFWTTLAGSLGLVTTLTSKAEMLAHLNGIWGEVFERLTTPEVMSSLMGDLEFSSMRATELMVEEILNISQKEMIRAVLQAYPEGATEHLLEVTLEKALTCEIQTIALKYCDSVN